LAPRPGLEPGTYGLTGQVRTQLFSRGLRWAQEYTKFTESSAVNSRSSRGISEQTRHTRICPTTLRRDRQCTAARNASKACHPSRGCGAPGSARQCVTYVGIEGVAMGSGGFAAMGGLMIFVWLLGIFVLIAWILLPFAMFGIKPLLRDLIVATKETNRLLTEQRAGARSNL
jgi:hypothetical protein